jgi:hypothetical protein
MAIDSITMEEYRWRISVQLNSWLYTNNAMAPPIIDRPSRPVKTPSCLATASPSDPNAIDGAALKSPAKLFGLRRSPINAKRETAMPPMRNRRRRSFHTPASFRIYADRALLAKFPDPALNRNGLPSCHLDFDLEGTFAPFFLASERPMAMACFRLVTRFPLVPLFKVPFLRLCIARLTDVFDFVPY